MIRHIFASAAIILAVACSSSVSQEIKLDSRVSLGDLLDSGWGRSTEARDVYDLFVAQRAAEGKWSARDAYGAGLVALKQSRFPDALTHFEETLRIPGSDFRGLRGYIWLMIVMDNYKIATPRLSEFAEKVLAETEASSTLRKEQMEFLGTLVGFLEEPAKKQINARELASQLEILEKTLSKEDKEIFDAARQVVRETYLELTANSDVEKADAKVVAEENRKKTMETLAADREALAVQQKELQPKREKLIKERDDELSKLQEQERPIASEMASNATRIASLEAQFYSIDWEIARLENLLLSDRNDLMRSFYLLEIQRLSRNLNSIRSNLVSLRSIQSGLALDRNRLAQQYQRKANDYNSQIAELENALTNVNRKLSINKLKGEKASKPASGSSPKANALVRQSITMRTYLDYPIESERLALLSELSKMK